MLQQWELAVKSTRQVLRSKWQSRTSNHIDIDKPQVGNSVWWDLGKRETAVLSNLSIPAGKK